MLTTKPYVQEDKETIAKRVAIATAHIEAGLTYKHAWFKAFQEVPRTYSDMDLLSKGTIKEA